MFKAYLKKGVFTVQGLTSTQVKLPSFISAQTFCEKNKKKQKKGQNEGSNQSLNSNSKPSPSSNKELKKPSQTDQARINKVEEQYNIVHHYEKAVPETGKEKSQLSKDKIILDKIVRQMLNNENISAERAEQIKLELRNPMNETHAPKALMTKTYEDMLNNIKNDADIHWHHTTFKAFDKLFQYVKEERDKKDPNFIKIRSIHKLVKNEDKYVAVPKTLDVRQNQHFPDYLKIQPRMTVNYSYNIEQHRDFHKMYEASKAEDLKKMIEKQKLIKYIKQNPNNHAVKTKLHKQNFPVTLDKLPNYDVDITGYKPPITKKSRRKYNVPKYNTQFSNFSAWRCFDREYQQFNEEDPCLEVTLSPLKLVQVNY